MGLFEAATFLGFCNAGQCVASVTVPPAYKAP